MSFNVFVSKPDGTTEETLKAIPDVFEYNNVMYPVDELSEILIEELINLPDDIFKHVINLQFNVKNFNKSKRIQERSFSWYFQYLSDQICEKNLIEKIIMFLEMCVRFDYEPTLFIFRDILNHDCNYSTCTLCQSIVKYSYLIGFVDLESIVRKNKLELMKELVEKDCVFYDSCYSQLDCIKDGNIAIFELIMEANIDDGENDNWTKNKTFKYIPIEIAWLAHAKRYQKQEIYNLILRKTNKDKLISKVFEYDVDLTQ